MIVSGLLTRVGTQVAAEAVAGAGGATAAGAAGGGGGGSLAGPAGTVIGVAVGLTVGIVIDVWMGKQFEHKMTGRLNEFFDSVTRHLVNGESGRPDSGLSSSLARAVERLNDAQRRAVVAAILEQPKQQQEASR
jgi:hypothetical protein